MTVGAKGINNGSKVMLNEPSVWQDGRVVMTIGAKRINNAPKAILFGPAE